MAGYSIDSDADVTYLIGCEKVIKVRPRKPMEENRSSTQRFIVYSTVDELQFSIFISQSLRMTADFSIGLMYGDHLLYRCNGFHGTTRNGFYSSKHHAYPHSHTLTIGDIRDNRAFKPSHITDLAGQYSDIKTAQLFFFKHCGIINYEEYFDLNQQLSFF